MDIQRILMPTDFSTCANHALTHAITLARRFGAELHLLHVNVMYEVEPTPAGEVFPGYEELHLRREEAIERQMSLLLDQRHAEGLLIVEAQLRAFSAAPAILDYVVGEQIDLVVLGTHGRRGLRRFVLGSVSEEVVRAAPCPVLTVRDEEEVERFHEMRRIVVPFDFSAESRKALDAARELAAVYGAQIDLVHVVEPPLYTQLDAPLGRFTFEFDREKFALEMKAEMTKLVDGLNNEGSAVGSSGAEGLSTDSPHIDSPHIEGHVIDGFVALALTKFAETSGADLILIASHGLGGLQHFLLGSVAAKVVRSASCPVLTLRHPAAD